MAWHANAAKATHVRRGKNKRTRGATTTGMENLQGPHQPSWEMRPERGISGNDHELLEHVQASYGRPKSGWEIGETYFRQTTNPPARAL